MGISATLSLFKVATLDELRALGEGADSAIEDAMPSDYGPGDPGISLSLDKSWHGLHFLLIGHAYGGEPPLAWAVRGNSEYCVGDSGGYVSASDAAAVASALATLDEEAILQRMHATGEQTRELYNAGDWSDPFVRGHYLSLFHELREFYAEAARRGTAVLCWVA